MVSLKGELLLCPLPRTDEEAHGSFQGAGWQRFGVPLCVCSW